MNKVSVIPFYPGQMDNGLFDPQKLKLRDNVLSPFLELKAKYEKEGYVIGTADLVPVEEADVIIFFDLDLKYILKTYFANKLQKAVYISFEPPVVYQQHRPEILSRIATIFNKMLTWQDDLVDNHRTFKFFFPVPAFTEAVTSVSFQSKKLITTIVGHKASNQKNELYSKRVEAIKYFEKTLKDFSFFGAGWSKKDFPSYAGKVDSKYDVLKQYKFVLSYENEFLINGLVSEKIFDCFYARTIPIFWGAENVGDYFPADTFVDKRNFTTYEELHKYLEGMSEEEYSRRLMAIEKYLISAEFQKHSCAYFAKTVFDTSLNPTQNKIKISNIALVAIYKTKQKILNIIKRVSLMLGRY